MTPTHRLNKVLPPLSDGLPDPDALKWGGDSPAFRFEPTAAELAGR